MSEEKNVNKTDEKIVEKKPAKSKKRIKILIIFIITVIFSLLVIGVIGTILFGDKVFFNNKNGVINEVNDAYRFSGEILFSQVSGEYSFVTEFFASNGRVGNVVVDFLHRNKLISKVTVAENIDIGKCSDFGIVFKDYNDDGMSDFSHIFSTSNGKSVYKIYTLKKDGKLELLDDKEYSFPTTKFSLGLEVINGEYKYNVSKIFYDGYEIGIDAKSYTLNGERNNEYKKVNENSRLSFEDGRSIDSPKYKTSDSLPKEFLYNNPLLERYDVVKFITIDLDGNDLLEKLVYLFDSKTNDTRITLFDSDDNIVVNFLNVKGKRYELLDIVEFMDIDNDGVIEFITRSPDSDVVTVSKYCLGYYFPEVEF